MLKLNDNVANYIPSFAHNGKSTITIWHLLTHTSGLPAHKKFYLDKSWEEQVIESINKVKTIYPIGKRVHYSDLGFILFYKIIEIVSDETFENFVHRAVFQPLAMKEFAFNPHFGEDRYAAIEFDLYQKRCKLGSVHDENAACMSGVSGHAGLFSTLSDF